MYLRTLSALAAIGASLSIWLSLHFYDLKNGTAGFKSLCNVGTNMNCDAVAASSYAEFFGGLPLSSFAAGWFVAILGVSLLARDPQWKRDAHKALLAMTGYGAATSAVYLVIMVAVIKTFCLFCLLVDAVSFAALFAAWKAMPRSTAKKSDAGNALPKIAGVVGAIVFVTVGVLAGIGTEKQDIPQRELVESITATVAAPVRMHETLPVLGNPAAPITIMEFSDFQCPHCKRGALIMNTLLSRYPDEVRVVFRNYPLDPKCNPKMQNGGHAAACEAAKTAHCAHQQGKFTEVYEALFERQETLAPGKPTEIAKEHGLDMAKFQACLESPETTGYIARDLSEGDEYKVQSTPTFFINGKKVEGAYPVSVWIAVIDQMLQSK